MNSEWRESDADGAIQRYEGQPNELDRPREATRWGRFLESLFPYLSRKRELGDRYLEAKTAREEGEAQKAEAEARKFAEEAAEIAARTDLARNRGVREYCDIVDDKLDLDPVARKKLKVAKLLEANPGVSNQLDKIQKMMDLLEKRHGTLVEMLPPGTPGAEMRELAEAAEDGDVEG